MPRCTVLEPSGVLEQLKKNFPDWKTSTLKQRLKNGLVLLNGRPVQSGAEEAAAGDVLEILAAPPRPQAFLPASLGEAPLPLLYADTCLMAVDKPAGLLSVASDTERQLTAVRIMREWLHDLEDPEGRELHAAHRLDREASGVLLFARSLELKRRLAASWSRFEKIYLVVTDGVPARKEGSIEVPLWEDKGLFVRVAHAGEGEEALTHYRVLRERGGRALLEVRLGTGRKHQIRVHLAHIGCPVTGDLRYGVSKAARLALHAHRLRLFHPETDREIILTAPVPKEFSRLV